jgi:transcriptional regulator with XRE-family HTH domain
MPLRQHKKIPNALRYYRERQHLKLYEVAQFIGLSSASHISHWEKGRKLPSLRNVLKLSIILNVQTSSLYFELFQELRREVTDQKARFKQPHS